MPVRRTTTARKKAAPKRRVGGLAGYQRAMKAATAATDKQIKAAEKRLKDLKKVKAAKKKVAAAKYRKAK